MNNSIVDRSPSTSLATCLNVCEVLCDGSKRYQGRIEVKMLTYFILNFLLNWCWSIPFSSVSAYLLKILWIHCSLPDLYAKLESHLIEEDDVFSIEDLKESVWSLIFLNLWFLFRLRGGDLYTRLEGAFVVAREHVEKCRRPENELVSVSIQVSNQ